MRVVVDANVVAAALVRPEGWTATELRRRDLELFAPEFLAQELEAKRAELARNAGVELGAWTRRTARVFATSSLVPTGRALRFAGHAFVKAVAKVDPKDGIYAATMISVKAQYFWTYDRALLRALPGRAVSAVP